MRLFLFILCSCFASHSIFAADVTNELPKAKVSKDLFSEENDEEDEPATKPTRSIKQSTAKAEARAPWFPSASEFLSYQTQRPALATDPSTKISTDGKRYDMTVGSRIPVHSWAEDEVGYGWSVGFDGGMLASLERYELNGKLTFATETFDGFFGAYLARAAGSWLLMLRTAHLSAHLVDNSPRVLNNTTIYNLFWNEFLAGYFFRDPTKAQPWNLYMQGSLGANNVAEPRQSNPRATLGLTFNHQLDGPDSLGVILSADSLRAGIAGQKMHYAYFAGIGRAGSLQSTMRPWRAGVTMFRGSDHRNQNYSHTNHFTAFTIQTDF